MTRIGSFAIVILCLSAAARAAQPAGVSLSLANGCLAVASAIDPNAPWVRYDNGHLTRTEGCGPFDGGVDISDAGGALVFNARKSTPLILDVIEMRLVQARDCSLSLTIRADEAGPGVTLNFCEADLTRLVLRHPEIRPYLDGLLAAIDPGCHWEPDEFAVAQLDPGAYDPPRTVSERVASAVAGLRSEDWRERRRAADALRSPELALYCCLRLDRASLSPEQRRGIEEAVRGFPLLTAADRETLKRICPRAGIPGGLPPTPGEANAAVSLQAVSGD